MVKQIFTTEKDIKEELRETYNISSQHLVNILPYMEVQLLGQPKQILADVIGEKIRLSYKQRFARSIEEDVAIHHHQSLETRNSIEQDVLLYREGGFLTLNNQEQENKNKSLVNPEKIVRGMFSRTVIENYYSQQHIYLRNKFLISIFENENNQSATNEITYYVNKYANPDRKRFSLLTHYTSVFLDQEYFLSQIKPILKNEQLSPKAQQAHKMNGYYTTEIS